VLDDGALIAEPIHILDHRTIKIWRWIVDQVKFQWDNCISHLTTWEDACEMHQQFPYLFDRLDIYIFVRCIYFFHLYFTKFGTSLKTIGGVCNIQFHWAHFIQTYSLRTLVRKWSSYDTLWLWFDYEIILRFHCDYMLNYRCMYIERYYWWVLMSVHDIWQVQDVDGINILPWTSDWVRERICFLFKYLFTCMWYMIDSSMDLCIQKN